jgi:trigger factor
MNYTTAPAEKSTVKVTMTFTTTEWNQAIDKAYVKTRGKYTVPGFRKGKAPKPVLENYYGKGVFFEEALNILYSENYPVVLEKEKENFTAVGEPSLDVEDLSNEKVVLTAVVPVKPDVTIEKYTGLKIKKLPMPTSTKRQPSSFREVQLR